MQAETRSRSEARRLDVQRSSASSRESPIIMSGPMVCAYLAGRKGETRRVVRFREEALEHLEEVDFVRMQPFPDGTFRAVFELGGEPFSVRCPYGGPGDRLWFRETWRAEERSDLVDGVRFQADGAFVPIENSQEAADRWLDAHDNGRHGEAWRPSIFLPRWAARIVTDVVDVRVERLQAITAEGAKAEGLATLTKDGGTTWKWGIPDRDGLPGTDDHGWPWSKWSADPCVAFQRGWDEINGGRGHTWESNPWVWVVSFRRAGESVR